VKRRSPQPLNVADALRIVAATVGVVTLVLLLLAVVVYTTVFFILVPQMR
jgi:hypothetical protein